MRRLCDLRSVLSLAALFVLTGCAGTVGTRGVQGDVLGISGNIHGGQQAVGFSTVQLYTVGTTGDGSPSTALLMQTVMSDAGGNFHLTGLYGCTGATLVYATATGGNPVPGTPNPNLAMMAVLGPCSSLTPGTFITINELTTVAAVTALSPYMTSLSAVGSGSGDVAGLAAAFALANELVSSSTGQTPGANVPAGMTVPTTLLNTLADVVASCINSGGGLAGSQTVCGSLFTLTTPPAGSAPADTIAALLDLAKNPTLNTQNLFGLISPQAPFGPTTPVPPADFRIRLTPAVTSSYVLQIGPSTLTFPSTVVATAAGVQTVVVSNSGTATITLGGLSFTGTNAGDFAKTTTCGSTLAAGANCQISVTFTPQATGTRMAYLSVASSSPDSPQYVQLSGTGVSAAVTGVPHAVISPGPIQLIYNVGSSYDLTLSNTGNAPLSISSITNLTTSNTLINGCGSSLAAGAACTVNVVSISPAIDQVTFATNDPNLTPGVALNSIQLAPVASPSDLYFPNTVVGSDSSATFTMQLSTTQDAFISGANSSDFVLGPNCTAQGTGYPSICTLTITFQPAAPGLRVAKLFYEGPSLGYIPLAGNGLASAANSNYTLTPSSLSFYDLAAPQQVTFTNYALSAISIQSIALQSVTGPSEFTQTNNCGASLPAQSVCTITVTSNRTVQGGSQGLLTVTGDFGSAGIPISNQLDQVYDFGAGIVGTAVQGFSLSSPINLNGSSLAETFSGTNPNDFNFNGGSHSCTASGKIPCQLLNYFQPTAPGPRKAILTATSVSGLSGTSTTTFQKYLVEGVGTTASVPAVLFGQTGFAAAPGQPVTFTVRNSGTTVLSIPTLPTFTGQTPGLFSGMSSNCGSISIGNTCVVSATINPIQSGVTTGTMSVLDTATGTTFSTPLYVLGYVGPPVSTTTVHFPDTLTANVSLPISVIVSPDHGHAVSAGASSNAAFQVTKATCTQGESPCVITFVFAPTVGGDFSSVVQIVDSYYGTGTAITLSGHGAAPVGPGVAGVSPGSLTFPLRPAGSTSIPQTITLSNTGLGPMAFTVALGGANMSEFSISSTTCTGTLASMSSCTIGVTFAPATAGGKSASVGIGGASGDGLPLSVSIVGSAN